MMANAFFLIIFRLHRSELELMHELLYLAAQAALRPNEEAGGVETSEVPGGRHPWP